MMLLKRLPVAIVIALVSTAALADGRSAAHNLFANLTRTNVNLSVNGRSVNESNTLVTSTLVRGMYALTSQQGKFIGFVNEAGTLFGDGRGFEGLSPDSTAFRPLTPEETADLRIEVMSQINADKLIKVSYGDGRSRLMLFSAIDCPACKTLEDSLRKNAAKENTTFYVVPMSLLPIDGGGAKQWQKVSNIWCANDSARAWRTYWETGATPVAGVCAFADPQVASDAEKHLQGILSGVGVQITGTPKLVREDGEILHKGVKPLQITLKPPRWLVASNSDDNFRPQLVGGQASGSASGQQPQKGKINVGDVLKGLFSK